MVIYFFPEILLFLVTVFSNKLSSRQTKVCLKIICLIFVCIFGLRSSIVGNDTSNYVSFFADKNSIKSFYGSIDDASSSLEPLFLTITRGIKFFSSSFTIWFLVISIWLWTAIYKFYMLVSGYKEIAPGLLAIFLMANTFVTLMVAMRQATAICVLLTGLVFIVEKGYVNGRIKFSYKNKKQLIGLFFVLLTPFIHKSMIALVPIVVLAYMMRPNKKILTGCVCVSGILSIFLSDRIGESFNLFFVAFGDLGIDFVNSDVIDMYADDWGGNTQKISTYLAWALPAIMTIHVSDRKKVDDLFFKLYILSVCFFLLFSTTYLIERINTPLMLLGFTRFWPDAATKASRWRLVYILFIFVLLINAFFRYNNWPTTDSCIPYYFFWEK